MTDDETQVAAAGEVPLLSIGVKENGGPFIFKSMSEIQQFIAREFAFWKFVEAGQNTAYDQVLMLLAHLRSALAKPGTDAEKLEGIKAALTDAFVRKRSRLPLSTTPEADLISNIATQYGPSGGAIALALAIPDLRQSALADRPEAMRVAVAYVLGEMGISINSQNSVLEATRRTLQSVQDLATADRGSVTAFLAEHRRFLDDEKTQTRIADATRLTEFQQQRAEIHESSRAAIAEIQQTNIAFTEQMRLQAPVTYWEQRADRYEREANNLLLGVVAYFGAMVLGGAALFAFHQADIASYILEFKESPGSLLVISAGFAILASIPLWAARIMVRFYLSAHHLATDARERMTMTQTYLALTKEAAADEKDRAIILAALFRNTQDGVVRDNTAPEMSIGGAIAKLLDR